MNLEYTGKMFLAFLIVDFFWSSGRAQLEKALAVNAENLTSIPGHIQ